ncbi:MAG: hypothetical protein Fur0010_06180 [Bdellovibrio sp.]
MKALILLAALGFSTFAAAETCEAVLEHSRSGRIEGVYRGFGYDYRSACTEAQTQCKMDLARRGGRNPMLQCRITSMQPTPPRPTPPRPIPVPPRGESCVANLKNRHGHIIERFASVSVVRRAACEDALRKCQIDLNIRHRDGRNPYAYCEVERGYQPDPYPTFFGACTVEKLDRFGYITQRFYATATGYSQFEAEQSACTDAERQCSVTIYDRLEYCRRANY